MREDDALKINTQVVANIVSSAILQSIPAENRDAIIKDAIHYLTETSSRGYGDYTSKLQEAFRQAVFDAAKKMAAELVANNTEIHVLLEGLVSQATKKFLTQDREKITDMIAANIAKNVCGLRGD